MNLSQLYTNKHLAAIIFCILYMNLGGLAATQAQSSSHWLSIEPLLEGLDLEKGDWVADIGSGRGTYLNKVAEVIGDDGHIFAVDINPLSFDGTYRSHDGLHGNMDSWDYFNISTIFSTPDNPLLPRSSFDAIMMRNTYHEFSDPKEMLEHFSASLKPGSHLAILDMMNEDLREESRAVQEDDHRLHIDYAIEDLESTGFEIVIKEQKLGRPSNNESHYSWLIIATPTSR